MVLKGVEFFEHLCHLDNQIVKGDILVDNAWLEENQTIYFVVDWTNPDSPTITRFYTPAEALDNLWEYYERK